MRCAQENDDHGANPRFDIPTRASHEYRRARTMQSRAQRYTVSDGALVLTLEVDPAGGYTVTSPIEPSLVTEAGTIPEAFANARDALKMLRAARAPMRSRARDNEDRGRGRTGRVRVPDTGTISEASFLRAFSAVLRRHNAAFQQLAR